MARTVRRVHTKRMRNRVLVFNLESGIIHPSAGSSVHDIHNDTAVPPPHADIAFSRCVARLVFA